MVWVRVDDDFADHPKIAAAGDLAPLVGWMHVTALCYCNRYATGGFIPDGQVARLAHVTQYAPLDEVVDALLKVYPPYRAGLWEKDEGGYRIHDYHDYQPDRESVKERENYIKHVRSKAGRKGAHARWQEENLLSQEPADTAEKMANDMANAQQNYSPVPVPVPVPVPEPVCLTTLSTRKQSESDYVLDVYRELCPSLGQIRKFDDKRRKAAIALWKALGDSQMREFFTKAEESDFLTARVQTERNWRAHFDWMMNEKNALKVLEGKFENRLGVRRNIANAMQLLREVENEQT